MRTSARALEAALAMLATSVVCVDRAHAGTYAMRACNVPGHASARIGPWQPLPALTVAVVDTCVSGGAIGFSVPGVRQMQRDTRAALHLARPSEGPRRTIGLVGLRLWLIARLTGSGSSLHVATTTRTAAGTIHQKLAAPPGADALRAPHVAALDPLSTEAIQVELVCADDTPLDCLPEHGTPLAVHGAEVTLVEDVAPAGSISGGTLLAAGDVSGVRSLRYAASDPQSGLARVEALIGDAVVATRDLTSRCAYADFTACPASDEGSLSIDTHDVPDGTHRVTLRLSDAASNQHVVHVPSLIQVANAGRANAPEALPSAVRARLAARFAGSSRSALTVSYGRRVTIRGRLSAASRRGLGRVAIDVLERPTRAGAREVAVGSVRTRADGTFSYAVARHGPSRTLRLTARDVAGRVAATSSPLTLRVRAASSLRASLRGVLVRFSGRVLSGPLPERGKRVTLHGRARGYAWAPFASVRTDRHGRFAGTYRLHAHRQGVELQIRVVVPTERGYPYLGYRGRPVTLRVR
ncbi:MAG: hypothetical protein QOJ63_3733 [Solirubrobacteraceae bacterium]|jgi:hypothetical protein|nr:hypothetical protein [Solirubrobacteraceae bacterium]